MEYPSRAEFRRAQRKAKREADKAYDREVAARHEKKVVTLAARCLRRRLRAGDNAVTMEDVLEYAEACISQRERTDYLARRTKPEVYRGWREDFPRHAAFLNLSGWLDEGLPLAHEGGSPPVCRDRVTFDLSMANLRKRQASSAAARAGVV